MWSMKVDILELIFRAAAVFTFLFIIFRLWGKKHFGQLTPFDFVLLLIISESVQNAIIGDDKSLPGGVITSSTMMLLNIILNKISSRSEKAERIIDGVPKVLVKDGKVDELMKKRETITDQELHEALRKQGVLDVDDVGLATIETNGEISVIKKEDMHHH
jgi:uncharacterized membrane protein YcaP (DUF421 family)